MTIPISQANRPLRATTPLGEDVLVAMSLVGEEEVSRPFLFTVDFLSANQSVTAASLLGKPIRLEAAAVPPDRRDVRPAPKVESNTRAVGARRSGARTPRGARRARSGAPLLDVRARSER